jgi:hypothetical protein
VAQPWAQEPVRREAGAVMPLPVGATMVMPLELTSVVLALAGHDVEPQSRPIWQHPPW